MLQDHSPASAGQLILTPHPLLLDGQRIETWHAAPGQSLAVLLAEHVPAALDDRQQWQVCIGGVPVAREHWARMFPKPGQVLEVRGAVGKAALGIVAVVALTYFTFGLGAYGGIAASLGGIAGAAAATGVFMAGSALINKVLAPKRLRLPGSSDNPLFSIAGTRNRMRPYEPFPVLFGRVRIAPDAFGKPYTWYQGRDQVLGIILTPGVNIHRIEDIYNAETKLTDYQGVHIAHAGYTGLPAQPLPLYSNVDTIDGGELNKNNAWVQRTTPVSTIRIAVNLEYTLGDNDRKGAKNNHETVEIQYQEIGATSWTIFETRRFVNNNYDPQRTAFTKDVPKGRYHVRARRLGRAIEHTQGKAQFMWTTMTCVKADNADYTGIARTAITITASGQLNHSPDELRCVAHASPLPVWNGSQWKTQETGNPGAQILAYARGLRAGNTPSGTLLAGIGLDDGQIDIEALKAFMLHCSANSYRYDYWQTESRSHSEVLDAIARAGFGEITWAGGRLGVVWAAPGQPLSGVVNMATIKQGRFQVDYTLANAADGIEYSYLDSEDWEMKTLRVPAPGVTTMLNPAQIVGEGITSEAHASRLARWHLAQSLYQYKDIAYSTDLEYLSYQRLSVLSLQHDMTRWGHGGTILSASKVGNAVTLALDDAVPAPTGGNAFIGLRIPGERAYRIFQVKPFSGASSSIQLNTAWPSDAPLPGTANNPASDTIWAYDFKQTPGHRVRVVAIEPEPDLAGAQVRVVPESSEFWDYVLTGHYVPAPKNPLRPALPVASKLTIKESQITQGNTVYTELSANFAITGAMAHASIHSAYKDGNDWSEVHEVATTRTTFAKWRIPASGTYRVIVRPHTADGGIGGATEKTYTTIGANIAPPAFDWFNVEELSGGLRRYTWGYAATTAQAPDFAGAEIRYLAGTHTAPDWASMIPLGSAGGYLTNGAEFATPPAGEWTFAARARNTSGIASSAIIVHKTLSESLGEQIGEIGQDIDDITQQQIDQQTALDAEILERTLGDFQTALAAANDAQNKAQAAASAALDEALAAANAALASATEQTDAALAQALAAADAALAQATTQTDALAAEIAEIANAPEWDEDDTYIAGWLVRHNNLLYRANSENTGQPPDQHSAIWELLGQYSSVAGVAAAALEQATTTASELAAEATRINALVARMPGGTGQLATQASINNEASARAAGDSANASLITAVQSSLGGKADASVVSQITTRVEGLEQAGSGTNMLINAGFGNGIAPWNKSQRNSTWGPLTLNLGGDDAHPPGMNALGVESNETVNNTGFVNIYSNLGGIFSVIPGERYMCSCWIANQNCIADFRIEWRSASAHLGQVVSPVLAPIGGGTDLQNWHRAVVVGTAPADACYARLRVRFIGNGNANPKGWILRPMMEQASQTQTEPSPWNTGGQETGTRLLAEASRIDGIMTRLPAGGGQVAGEAALVAEQTARVQGDANNAASISAEATRINGVLARLPGGTGQLATQASINNEASARAAGDSANASLITAVQSSLGGKADASVVQLMQTKVAGLEGEGHNSNLLTNATLNSGTNGWIRTQTSGSNWSAPAVNLLGDAWHPPGINTIAISHAGTAPSGEYAVLRSPNAAVTPGQRYIASCYLANHVCNARLIVMWFDAAGAFLFSSLGDVQTATTASKTLATWPRRSMVLIAPAGVAYVAVCGMFIGTGASTYAYGWMLRPMLEHARAAQTDPSPWNPGGMETSAEYSLVLQANNMIGGLRMHNNGAVMDATFLATIFRVLSPAGAPNGLELQNGTLRVWRGNAQRIIGNGFGPNGDLMDYFGPNVGVSNASKSNATMWMDIHGNAYWGGEIASGPLTFTTQTASTQTVGLELLNGPFQTNGNLRTVTINFSRHSTYTKQAHGGGISLGGGSNTATIELYRKIGTGAEVLWQTITATGSCSFNNEYDGPSVAWASWIGGKTVTDTSPSTATVRYRAKIIAFGSQQFNVTAPGFNTAKHTQSLKITSAEG